MPAFELPDTTTSLPVITFEFDPSVEAPARELLAGEPDGILRELLRDQESEVGLLAARRIIEAFRTGGPGAGAVADDADRLIEDILAVRDELAGRLSALEARHGGSPEVREAVLRQRAPLALLAGCWLDTVSQPATQPAVVVNRLFGDHFELQGSGNPQRGVHHERRRALEQAGVFLPAVDAADFTSRAQTRPLTALHALCYLSLARLPASFLPEVAGVHYAYHLLGVDDVLLGEQPRLGEARLRAGLVEYFALSRTMPTGAADRRRLAAAVALVVALEREHVTMLEELASWHAGLTLEAKVGQIIARHARYAGSQHGDVRVAGHQLCGLLDDPDLDVAAFVRTMRDSRQLRPIRGGDGRFLRAIKFGGPMFGVFDEREAAVFKAWAEAAAAGELPDAEPEPDTAGDEAAARWSAALAAAEPADVRFAVAAPADDRALFHRLVNIETHPNTLRVARERVAANLRAAEVLFSVGAAGRYTDASWFDYTPAALFERVESIYFDKLVRPYRPLRRMPDRDEVVFGQKTYALGSLIDGTWAHRIGNVGRYHRLSDGMLAAIYADEMGRGDLQKNHITLIHQVLRSMDIDVPHIRDAAFLDQGELPDHLYGFSIHQVCLALFPDSHYPEILGYNLGIEMFGLGEMRMHEMSKLKHHGFDPGYEQAHLSIDNFSAGHARQSADIVVAYLDDVARTVGADAVPQEWRRVWRGYASFAYFIEHALVRDAGTQRHDAGLLI